MRARAREAFEIGKLVEGEIDFAGGAAKFVAADAFEKIGGKLAGLEEFLEREMRIDAGRDDVGGEFFAILENDAGGTAILDEDFADRRFGADFHAGLASCVRDRVRNGSSAAAAEAPGTERAVDFSHVVVKEDVGGARRTNAEECADDAGSGHGGFQNVRFEPLVKKIGGAHGHELDESVALVGRKFAEALEEEVELL